MPESKKNAEARAKREGFPKSSVVKSKEGGYFIAPHGVSESKAKRAYADCRGKGGDKGTCAAISHNIQKKK